MKTVLLLLLLATAVVAAKPCRSSGAPHYGRGYSRGYGRLARGPLLAPVGGTLPSYSPEKKRRLTPGGCRRTTPSWVQNSTNPQIRRSIESAPPGY